jgi:hypothetical protein
VYARWQGRVGVRVCGVHVWKRMRVSWDTKHEQQETRTTLGTDSARNLHSWAGGGDGRRLAPTRACTVTGVGVDVRFGLPKDKGGI